MPRRTVWERLPLWAFALIGVLPTMGFWLSGLLDLDEGFYGAVAAEMNRRSEWITPYFNGAPWFEKPILVYWLAKPSLMLFGEAGARLPSALSLFFLLLATAQFARWAYGERAARLAPLVLGGMLLPAIVGRLLMTDMPLALFLSIGMYAFARSLPLLVGTAGEEGAGGRSGPTPTSLSQEGDPRSGGAVLRLTLCGAALGAATLAKGPVALLLFGPPALWALKSLGWPRQKGLLGFALAYLAVVATWYGPAYLANGQVFVQKFLIEQNIGRFTGGDAAHTLGIASLPLYIPVVLLGALPYTGWGFKVWRGGGPLAGFLRAWIVWTFVFFSISGAKLPHYVLPLFPPLALLIAHDLASRERDGTTRAAAWCAGLGVLLTLVQSWWYGSLAFGPGTPALLRRTSGQAEAHELARAVRPEENLILYRLSRRKTARGTSGLEIQETSLPSLFFVTNRAAPDVEELGPYLSLPTLTIFTREGRLGAAERAQLRAHGFFLVGEDRLTHAVGGPHYVVARYSRLDRHRLKWREEPSGGRSATLPPFP